MALNTRSTWLQKLFGNNAEQVETALADVRKETQGATQALDAVGMIRKAATDMIGAEDETTPDEKPPAPPSEPPTPDEQVDDVLRAAQTLASQIKAGVAGDFSKLTEDGLTVALADAMRAAMPDSVPAEEETEIVEEDEEETIMDDNKAMSDSAEAITKAFGQMVEDNGAMARLYTEQQAEIAEIKSLKPTVDQLVTAVNELKRQMGDRGRGTLASESDLNEPDLTAEERKSLQSAIEKGLKGAKTTFLGVPVKEIPK